MTLDDIVNLVGSFEGTVTQRPREGDGTPEIAWGDAFFYYSPDGTIPTTQPFATIVTKNYPGDELSGLDRPDAFRVNIVAGKQEFEQILGVPAREAAHAPRADSDDVLAAHPQYGTAGWLSVVNPSSQTETQVRQLLDSAYNVARRRYERRQG
ncbi:hypothetical protein CH251_01320 [Rhodococcus sp. 06-462-5]|uniref:DUF6194 family protein n=1 Tax=unclassified Rhodococcus (in: high G+C Gram-positive bacteria) TaxID=192944 RepID=UPI000B9A85A7|nr:MULTISPECIES: DUF6194 family protein [unclassified Rhodococcus (in: high G+C Gram-positive bacteria)]OZC79548.1 hypothetical protein CH251_01320 [Rhodococcus sp. 06-462-5]OZE60105.1 hypothetical protein CH270_23260 [Rhodococcus sp. 02-925g]